MTFKIGDRVREKRTGSEGTVLVAGRVSCDGKPFLVVRFRNGRSWLFYYNEVEYVSTPVVDNTPVLTSDVFNEEENSNDD